MKKITSYILSIFCIFTMVAFFACGEEHNLKLEQNYVFTIHRATQIKEQAYIPHNILKEIIHLQKL